MSKLICALEDLNKKIGWYTARDVCEPENGRVLLKTNCKIVESIIPPLKRRDIEYVYISDVPVEITETLTDSKGDIIELRQVRKVLKNVFKETNAEIMSNIGKNKSITMLSEKMVKNVTECIERMIDAIIRNPTASMCLDLMDEQDPYLLKHSVNVTYLTLCMVANSRELRNMLRCDEKGLYRFATNKNFDPIDLVPLGISCLLHDIGKILIMDVVNADETYETGNLAWDRIKEHPRAGHDILFGKRVSPHTLLGVKYHHENLDGTGYPYGIKGYKIHIYSRIIRIVDSYDAATTDRPGRPAKDREIIFKELKELSGTHYDQEIVDCFLEFMQNNREG